MTIIWPGLLGFPDVRVALIRLVFLGFASSFYIFLISSSFRFCTSSPI